MADTSTIMVVATVNGAIGAAWAMYGPKRKPRQVRQRAIERAGYRLGVWLRSFVHRRYTASR